MIHDRSHSALTGIKNGRVFVLLPSSVYIMKKSPEMVLFFKLCFDCCVLALF